VRQVGPVDEVFRAPVDLEVARTVGTENVLRARVVAREGGLATVAVGDVHLVGLDPGGAEETAFACFRAEEVTLEEPAEHATTARNRLAGTVRARLDEGPLVRVTVDCGAPVVALVTRRSADALELVPGRRVAAVVKAPAVRIVPRAPAHPDGMGPREA
jgi:molybdate transport system ATP-binding protein